MSKWWRCWNGRSGRGHHQPRQNPARENFAGGLRAVSSSGHNPDLWGAGDGPVVDGRSGLAQSPAPHRQGISRAFRTRDGSPSCKACREPWAVSSRSALWRPNPAFSHPRVSDAAGMCQAGVCGDAACVRRAARPDEKCGSNAAGGSPYRRQPVPAIRAKDPCPDPPRSGRPRADRGFRFASSWLAGTAPARQNSPPSADQSSVSPGHPFGTEGQASIAWGERVGKKWGEFFWQEARQHGGEVCPARRRHFEDSLFQPELVAQGKQEQEQQHADQVLDDTEAD